MELVAVPSSNHGDGSGFESGGESSDVDEVFLLDSRERELDEFLVSTEEVERVSISTGSGGIDGKDCEGSTKDAVSTEKGREKDLEGMKEVSENEL